MSHPDDHAEILRMRDRLHSLESGVAAARWHIDDLREWRAQVGLQLEQFAERLDEQVSKDAIAEAVAAKLKEQRDEMLTEGTFTFTKRQAQIAAIMAVIAVLSPWMDRLIG